MFNWKEWADLGMKMLTLRRLIVAGAVAAGVYTVGDDAVSYVSTATRLAGDQVNDHVPIAFELERAKTMIDSLVPDIKRNMIVIAQEEVAVDEVREEAARDEQSIVRQRETLLKLRDDAGDGRLQIGSRTASQQEVKDDLQRRLAHLKLSEATLQAKYDLLKNRETSLVAARQKLEKMLHARRDLEAQVENLHARLRTFQSSAVASTVELDDTQVAKCQQLVDELRVRLRVSERLVSTSGNIDELAVAFTSSDEDVFAQIDEHLRPSTSKKLGAKQ